MALTEHPHKFWHSRGYLPHFDAPDIIQAITFRLNDALPQKILAQLAANKEKDTSGVRRARFENILMPAMVPVT